MGPLSSALSWRPVGAAGLHGGTRWESESRSWSSKCSTHRPELSAGAQPSGQRDTEVVHRRRQVRSEQCEKQILGRGLFPGSKARQSVKTITGGKGCLSPCLPRGHREGRKAGNGRVRLHLRRSWRLILLHSAGHPGISLAALSISSQQ